eukprot:TRINITY_DN26841_c0_g2_i1.p2 TRINITY_DN26841_c0_g2~~TRINITY_DN26841_c0_g2_i1.p2  ORF type:complete len:236 (+),score=48.12 TRINITY_DN26841_c0_g2_i1:37-744(+)
MKLNIADRITGGQKTIEIEDDRKMRCFFDKRISHEVEGGDIDPQFNGYVFKITGGHDKQGFAMYQGVLQPTRVRLLLNSNSRNNRQGRKGSRQRKSVRGCICSHDLSVINVTVIKKGDAEIAGVTDVKNPARLGPKRANNIRKLFGLTKEEDVRPYAVRRTITRPEGKGTYVKAPAIQRLITPERLRHKRREKSLKKMAREKTIKERAKYVELIHNRRQEALAKKRTKVAGSEKK